MKTPTVSIVVPVYNGEATIGACLESLLAQDYPSEAYEIIVVDNCSTDNTSQVAKNYPVSLFRADERGPAAARNLGILRSSSEIIAFTDADCVASPQWLSKLIIPYADPKVGGVGGAILANEHPHRDVVEIFSDEHSPLVNFISGDEEFLPHLYTANASYRREHINQVGGFNTKLITGQDVDLAWRIQLQTKAKLRYVPEAVIYHHHRATKTGLARQYRRYGFGEIVLDTIYGEYSGYPRNRGYQIRRILSQLAALPRYGFSVLIRQIRFTSGRATPYQVTEPRLWFLIESNNIRGKIEGLIATRMMTSVHEVFKIEPAVMVDRLYSNEKE